MRLNISTVTVLTLSLSYHNENLLFEGKEKSDKLKFNVQKYNIILNAKDGHT